MCALVVGTLLFPSSVAFGANSPTVSSESVSGDTRGYQTTVDTVTVGTLTAENLRQASLLASQGLMHILSATRQLDDRNQKAAGDEIEKALTLVGIIREMLPTTTETTVVKDPDGAEVYRHEQRVQDDLIPIYDEMIQVEVVEPIVTAKRNRAAVEGVRLADVDLIHTSVLVDLGSVERGLKRAKNALSDPDEARVELLLAQTAGVRFVSNKKDTPLVETLRALRLAERMAEEKNYAAAEANLALAENQLALYRGLVPESEHERIGALEKEISALAQRVEEGQDSPGTIRGFWTRVTSWMDSEPGQASITNGEGEEARS